MGLIILMDGKHCLDCRITQKNTVSGLITAPIRADHVVSYHPMNRSCFRSITGTCGSACNVVPNTVFASRTSPSIALHRPKSHTSRARLTAFLNLERNQTTISLTIADPGKSRFRRGDLVY